MLAFVGMFSLFCTFVGTAMAILFIGFAFALKVFIVSLLIFLLCIMLSVAK